MKKAIVVICVIMLVFLLGCSKKDMFETQTPKENSTFLSVTTEVMQTDQDGTENLPARYDNYWNDDKPIRELLTKTYRLDELESFFQQYFSVRDYISDGTKKPTLMFDELDVVFPVEMLRSPLYSVYLVEEGGLFYVFWSTPYWLKEIPQSDDNCPRHKKLAVEITAYIPNYDRKLDFKSVRQGSGTAEEIIRIDPYFDINFLFSSGARTYHYINSEEIMVIFYHEEQELDSYSKMIVREKRRISRQDPSPESSYSLIFPEDLPELREEGQ